MATQQIVEGAQMGYVFPLMLPLITASVVLSLFYYWMQNRRIAKLGNLIPGPPTLPLLGNAHIVIGKNHNGELCIPIVYYGLAGTFFIKACGKFVFRAEDEEYPTRRKKNPSETVQYFVALRPENIKYWFLFTRHDENSAQYLEIMELALKLGKKYTNVARVWIGPKLVVILTNPSDIEIILNSNVYIQKSDEYRFFKPWLGNGLLISNGDHWRSHRKLIAPAFHQNVLKSFVGTFNSNSLNVVKRMEKEVGKVFDIHDYMSETTVDILLETAMGHKRMGENDDGFQYAMAVMKMCDILHARHLKAYLRFDSVFNLTNVKKQQEKLLSIIHGLTKRVIKEKKALYEKNLSEGNVPSPSLAEIIADDYVEKTPTKKVEGLRDDLDDIDENDVGEKRRLAFLDLMIEAAKNGANLSDDEIKEEVDTIMFEGHDTTAAGSSFALCLMAIHQDVQARVYKELKSIFGDSSRECTFADTMEMKYLERVILESLRMYPPVPIIARKINEDVQLASENYVLPAGCTVVIGTFKVHRREDIYPNPEVFNPDNFLPERTQNRHYYSFIPFSAGPRSCVGRKYAMIKLKILISTILRNYRVKSDLKESDFRLQGDIILKRSDGFRIEIEPRVG